MATYSEKKLSEFAYDEDNLLKVGSNSRFHSVTFRDEKIAVKKLDKGSLSKCCAEAFDLLKQLDHPNVVRMLFFYATNDYYKYRINYILISR